MRRSGLIQTTCCSSSNPAMAPFRLRLPTGWNSTRMCGTFVAWRGSSHGGCIRAGSGSSGRTQTRKRSNSLNSCASRRSRRSCSCGRICIRQRRLAISCARLQRFSRASSCVKRCRHRRRRFMTAAMRSVHSRPSSCMIFLSPQWSRRTVCWATFRWRLDSSHSCFHCCLAVIRWAASRQQATRYMSARSLPCATEEPRRSSCSVRKRKSCPRLRRKSEF